MTRTNIEKRVYTILKDQKMTKHELAFQLNTSVADMGLILRRFNAEGVELIGEGKGQEREYFIKTYDDEWRRYIISGPSRKIEQTRYVGTSDWHMASKQHDNEGLESCMEQAIDKGAEFILHSGDLVDGYKVYNGHMNNLKEWEVDKQVDIAAEFIDKLPIKAYGIGGNHEHSYTKQNGVRPIKLLGMKTDNFKDLGDFQADVIVAGQDIRLLHGAGGNAYARSYPAQVYLRNLAEGTPDQVPDVLQLGHYHTNLSDNIYGAIVYFAGNFQRPNDYCIRRGLRGVRGLWLVTLETQYGALIKYDMKFIKSQT